MTNERIAELRRRIKDKNYIDSAIDMMASKMATGIDDIEIDQASCLGVRCSICVDRVECVKAATMEENSGCDMY